MRASGVVSGWYSHPFEWGTLVGAVMVVDKPFRANGVELDDGANFGRQAVTPEASHLLLVPRQPDAPWGDVGTVQVELRAGDPLVDDRPGWWLSADAEYETRRAGSGWSRLRWRRVLTGSAIAFGLAAFTAAIGFGGSSRHLAYPGTTEWPQGLAAATIGAGVAALAVVVVVRAAWMPRVRQRALVLLAVMASALVVLAMIGIFIATYGDPAPV